MSSAPHDVASAVDRATAAYQAARRLVFDQYPPGQVPPTHELDVEQRMALDELAAAEAALRVQRWATPTD